MIFPPKVVWPSSHTLKESLCCAVQQETALMLGYKILMNNTFLINELKIRQSPQPPQH